MDLSELVDNPFFIGWGVGLPASYIILCIVFRQLNLWPEALAKGTRGSDYMCFDIVAGSSLTYFGFVGTVAWLEIFGPEWSYRLLERDKFYDNADFVQNHLIIPIMLYQFWNTILCLILSDIRDPVMIVHHMLTETTQLSLTVIDVLDHFPLLRNKYPTVDALSKGVFGLMFFSIRIFYWTIVSLEFWTGSMNLLQQPYVHDVRVVLFMLFANIILTTMQYFWAFKILKVAFVSDSAKGDDKKKLK